MKNKKRCTVCKRRRALSSFHKRSIAKDGRQTQCKACRNEYQRARYAEDPKRAVDAVLRSRERHPESHRKASAKFYRKHKSKVLSANKERVKALRAENPGYNAALGAWRKCALMSRVPRWVKLRDFFETYNKSKRRGKDYVVDHLVPLRGINVSGLHVPENLQIITRDANTRKSNSFDPETHEHEYEEV